MNMTQVLGWLPQPQWVVGIVLAGAGLTGLLAALSPRLFSRLATFGSTWVDVDTLFRKLDRRVDIDQYVLRYGRLFGLLVVAAVLLVVAILRT